MNENFRKLYKESNYSAVGFSQIIGVSRQRFYRIINNKQILRETTYYKYKIKFLKNQKRITKKQAIKKALRFLNEKYSISQ